jgi:tripeptide aminopeptidase
MKEAIQTLITSDKMAHAFEYLKQDEAHTIDQQIELVQISSFSPFEEKRAIRFKELLTEADLDPVMDEVHNVYAHIHGTGNGPTLYVSAHLDTVFPPETPLPVKREGTKIYAPGIGDDTRGLAEILTLARAIKESGLKPVGDIIIGGNVGEEGLGDLRGMRHFFSQNADKVDGFISVDGAGCLICHGGTGSHRYEVTFRGPGGHSFGAFGLVNPIFAMGRAISYISELRTPREPKTTFSVGVVNGGTSINAIAYECSMLVDIRSNGLKELEELDAKLQDCIKRAVKDENNRWETERSYEESKDSFDHNGRITVEVKQIGNRPAGSQPKDCEIVSAAAAAFEACNETVEYDANIPISLGIPAICVGGGGKGGACHSVDEWYDSKDAYKGSQRVLAAIFALVGLDGVSEPLLSRRKK